MGDTFNNCNDILNNIPWENTKELTNIKHKIQLILSELKSKIKLNNGPHPSKPKNTNTNRPNPSWFNKQSKGGKKSLKRQFRKVSKKGGKKSIKRRSRKY